MTHKKFPNLNLVWNSKLERQKNLKNGIIFIKKNFPNSKKNGFPELEKCVSKTRKKNGLHSKPQVPKARSSFFVRSSHFPKVHVTNLTFDRRLLSEVGNLQISNQYHFNLRNRAVGARKVAAFPSKIFSGKFD